MSRLYDVIKASLDELKERAEGKPTNSIIHPRKTAMKDQDKHVHSHRETVDEYVHSHNPSAMKKDIPFKLREYISYVDANHITDPDEIPDNIIESFFSKDNENDTKAT